MMSQRIRVAAQAAQALASAGSQQGAQTAAATALPAVAQAVLSNTGALAGLQQRRPVSTVMHPTLMGTPEGLLKDTGHIQLQTTLAEQQKYGLAPVYGHRPDGNVSNYRPVSVPMVDAEGRPVLDAEGRQRHKIVGSGMAPALPMSKDTLIPLNKSGVVVIDHGELSENQAAILKKHDGPFDPQYDLVGEKAANCVTAANALHIELGLTDEPVGLFTTPQEAAALVKDRKVGDADTY